MGVLKEIVYRLFIFVVIIRRLAASEYPCESAGEEQYQCSYGCCEEDGTVTCCKLLPVDVRTIVIGIGFLCTAVLLIAVMAKIGQETEENDKDIQTTGNKDEDNQTLEKKDESGSDKNDARCCFCSITRNSFNCNPTFNLCPRK
ncbi:uncharacterized protein LOC128551677 isoform X2 [Mercenaria mercenaria]|uniref:uncharacterized protein LOC128551677 isoform X2 n=1 Tax=Mercenaria mercenaria TaxID=6596 RepID=UPI00234E75E9|nr:uncharacterized protein LOC128551677 isoform X2 [Mercenaria mercenaria]